MLTNRKQYLINPKFQYSFIAFCGLGVVLSLLLVLASDLYYLSELKAVGEKAGLPQNHFYFGALNDIWGLKLTLFGFTTCAILAVWGFVGMYLSNKVAGPVYRLQKHLIQVRDNPNYKEDVIFRKGDYFTELADVVNDIHGEGSKKKAG